MTTLMDRLFRTRKLKKYAGKHVSEIVINRTSEKHLRIEWTFYDDPVTFDIDDVCYVGQSKDIWDELHWRECEMVQIEIQKQIKIWCDKAGIAHQSAEKKLF